MGLEYLTQTNLRADLCSRCRAQIHNACSACFVRAQYVLQVRRCGVHFGTAWHRLVTIQTSHSNVCITPVFPTKATVLSS